MPLQSEIITFCVSPVRTESFKSLLSNETLLKFSCPTSHLITIQQKYNAWKSRQKKKVKNWTTEGDRDMQNQNVFQRTMCKHGNVFALAAKSWLNIQLLQSWNKAIIWNLTSASSLMAREYLWHISSVTPFIVSHTHLPGSKHATCPLLHAEKPYVHGPKGTGGCSLYQRKQTRPLHHLHISRKRSLF